MRPPQERATSSGCGATKTWVMAGRVYRAATGRPSLQAVGQPVAAAGADERHEHAGAVGRSVHSLPCRVTTVRIWRSRGPTGMTSRPPSASWSRSASGRSGAAAVTMIPSHGAPSGRRGCRRRPGPRPSSPKPSSASRVAADAARSGVALDGRHAAAERGEDRRLVARIPCRSRGCGRPGRDAEQLGHPGDHVRLADRLAGIDRERLVGVGVAAAPRPATKRSRGTAPIASRTRSSRMPRPRSWSRDHPLARPGRGPRSRVGGAGHAREDTPHDATASVRPGSGRRRG